MGGFRNICVCILAQCLVRVSIIDHQTSPLSHLSEVPVGVVEVLDGGYVGLRVEGEGELEARLVAKYAGQDGDVATLVENLSMINIFMMMNEDYYHSEYSVLLVLCEM